MRSATEGELETKVKHHPMTHSVSTKKAAGCLACSVEAGHTPPPRAATACQRDSSSQRSWNAQRDPRQDHHCVRILHTWPSSSPPFLQKAPVWPTVLRESHAIDLHPGVVQASAANTQLNFDRYHSITRRNRVVLNTLHLKPHAEKSPGWPHLLMIKQLFPRHYPSHSETLAATIQTPLFWVDHSWRRSH